MEPRASFLAEFFKKPRDDRKNKELSGNRGLRLRLTEFVGAVGAIAIGFRDFLSALRAGRVQIGFAVGAEVEARAYGGAAFWARIRQRSRMSR